MVEKSPAETGLLFQVLSPLSCYLLNCAGEHGKEVRASAKFVVMRQGFVDRQSLLAALITLNPKTGHLCEDGSRASERGWSRAKQSRLCFLHWFIALDVHQPDVFCHRGLVSLDCCKDRIWLGG